MSADGTGAPDTFRDGSIFLELLCGTLESHCRCQYLGSRRVRVGPSVR